MERWPGLGQVPLPKRSAEARELFLKVGAPH